MKVKTPICIALAWLLINCQAFAQIRCQTQSHCPIQVDPCDEVWLVSARDFSCGVCAVDQLRCQRYFDGQWHESSMPELTATNEILPSVVFVHGYQTDLEDAQTRGIQVYENLFLKCRQTGPVRYIVWAWRSERETRRLLKDYDIKSHRAVALGDLFASTIDKLGSRPATIIGYSLGAQVVVSAFSNSHCYQGEPVNVAVIAAANECGFASCCNRLLNCGNIYELVVFHNEGDRVIRAANLFCKVKYGSCFKPFPEFAEQHSDSFGQLSLIDITDVATRNHSIVRYSALPIVQSCVQQLVLQR